MDDTATRREKVEALAAVLRYDPLLAAAVVLLSLFAALLEGIGLGFVLPIVEQADGGGPVSGGAASNGGLVGGGGDLYRLFESGYAALGVPFTIEFLLAGVAAMVVSRYAAGVLAAWLQARLGATYVRDLKRRTFERVIDARTGAVEDRDRERLVNAVVTQANYPAHVLSASVSLFQQCLVAVAYLAIAAYLAPMLTLFAIVALGGITALVRVVVEPAYATGDGLAAANEEIQAATRAGVRGHRTVKLYDAAGAVLDRLRGGLDRYVDARVSLTRNEALLGGLQNSANALVVFALLYLALVVAPLSMGSAGLFLFAMFRLGPQFSGIHGRLYYVAGNLPHLVRARRLLDDLAADAEPTGGRPAPSPVTDLAFEDVSFDYGEGDPDLEAVSFAVEAGEFVALVGPSGAGKSTIVSLLARLYYPDAGTIRANGRSLAAVDADDWRDRVAVVQQDTYVLNETLRYNVTLGAGEVSRGDLDRACRLAGVDEFLPTLPAGYDTVLGDDGVRLSGGQRQRVAIARALASDPDVLVLDEATSDLDAALEARVHDALAAMDGVVTVAVAHRLSTVRDADRIYTVEDGRITEVGSHEELLARDDTYATLFGAQTAD